MRLLWLVLSAGLGAWPAMPYPESLHNYLPNTDETQVWVQPGAPANIWVTFDPLTETEDGFDFIYLYDALNNPVGDPAGYTGTRLQTAILKVTGDTIKVRLVSDAFTERWGYKVTNVASAAAAVTVIDSLNKSFLGVNNYRYQSGTFVGPIEWGGALYAVAKPQWFGDPDRYRICVYKSVDNGLTWTILDSGQGAYHASSFTGIDYQGGDKIYFCVEHDDLPGVPPAMAYRSYFWFQTFDLATETFSVVTSAILPWMSQVGAPAVVWRPNTGTYRRMASGNELVSYWMQNQVNTANSKHWGAWNGAAWALDAFPNIVQAFQYPKISLVDPAGVCHLFYYSEVDKSSWYTQLDELGGNTAPVSVGPFTMVYNGVVSVPGTDLLFAAKTAAGDSAVGTPALIRVAPFNNLAPVITVTNLAPGYLTNGAYLIKFGTRLYYVFLCTWTPASVGNEAAIYYCTSDDDGITWSAPTLIHDEATNPTFPDEAVPDLSGLSAAMLSTGELGIVMHVDHGLYALASFLAFMAAPPAPPAPAALPSPSYYHVGKPYLLCGNVWDWCLRNDQRLWACVDWSSYLCRPCRCWRDIDNPLHAIPEEGREFHKYGAIGVPAVAGVDTQIFQFNVPLGYDGIIYGVLCKYVGWGYVNGSGDLFWRFRMNRHWIKSLHAIPTELGDFTAYAQLDEFVRVYSGQTIRAFGWLSPASGIIPAPDQRLIAAVQGWYYPMGLYR